MINRRRFIAISASTIAMGGAIARAAAPSHWTGRAFGADVSIKLYGTTPNPPNVIEAARDTIFRLEKQFSIYDSASALSKLNRVQRLMMPPEFSRLIRICDQIHKLTDGLFDPTVQPLFEAYRDSLQPLSKQQIVDVQKRTGWRNVIRSGQHISFAQPDMSLTLNGIAQGFASDRVAEVLMAHGFEDATVNIGEYRVGPTPVDMRIQNQSGAMIEQFMLQNASIATTSRLGYRFANGRGHILSATQSNPSDFWNTVSIVASSAAMADGLSTALALAPNLRLARKLQIAGVILKFVGEDRDGKIHRIG